MRPSAVAILFPAFAVGAGGQKTPPKGKTAPPAITETRPAISNIPGRTEQQRRAFLGERIGVGPQRLSPPVPRRSNERPIQLPSGEFVWLAEGEEPPHFGRQATSEFTPTAEEAGLGLSQGYLMKQGMLRPLESRTSGAKARESVVLPFIDRSLLTTTDEHIAMQQPGSTVARPLSLADIAIAREFWAYGARRQGKGGNSPEGWADAILRRFDAIANNADMPEDAYSNDPGMWQWMADAQNAMDARNAKAMESMVRTKRSLGDQGESYSLIPGRQDFANSIRQMLRTARSTEDVNNPEWRQTRIREIWNLVELAQVADLEAPREVTGSMLQDPIWPNTPGAIPLGDATIGHTAASWILGELETAAPPQLRETVLRAINEPGAYRKITQAISDYVNTEDAQNALDLIKGPTDTFMTAWESAELHGAKAGPADVNPQTGKRFFEEYIPEVRDNRIIRITEVDHLGRETQHVFYTTGGAERATGDITLFDQKAESGESQRIPIGELKEKIDPNTGDAIRDPRTGRAQRYFEPKDYGSWREEWLTNPNVTEISVVPKAHTKIWHIMGTTERMEQGYTIPREPESMFSPQYDKPLPSFRPPKLGTAQPGLIPQTNVLGQLFGSPRAGQLPATITSTRSKAAMRQADPAESARLAASTQEILAGLDDRQLSTLFRPGEKGQVDWNNAKGMFEQQINLLNEERKRLGQPSLGVPDYDANKMAFFVTDTASQQKDFWSITKPETLAVMRRQADKGHDMRRKLLMVTAQEYFSAQQEAVMPGTERQQQIMQMGR